MNGRDGLPGLSCRGKDGVDGKKGNDGVNGTNGVDGRDGKDGKDCITSNWKQCAWNKINDGRDSGKVKVIIKNWNSLYPIPLIIWGVFSSPDRAKNINHNIKNIIDEIIYNTDVHRNPFYHNINAFFRSENCKKLSLS